MDPNANLAEQRVLAAKLLEDDDPDTDDVTRLCELVLSLDQWICRGGFLPKSWTSSANGES